MKYGREEWVDETRSDAELNQLKEDNARLEKENKKLQSRILGLDGELKTWKEVFHEQRQEIVSLKNEDLQKFNDELLKSIKEKEQRALIRQFAINVEFECKVDIANELSNKAENDLELNLEYDDEYTEQLKSLPLRKLWNKLGSEDQSRLWNGWFGTDMKFDELLNNLQKLKQVFNSEAHPVQHGGADVNSNDIKQFLSLHFDFTSSKQTSRYKRALKQPTWTDKDATEKWHASLIEFLGRVRNQNEPFLKTV